MTAPNHVPSNPATPRPTGVCVQPDNIPVELTRRPQWVAWHYRGDGRKQRWQKPPIAPRTGELASASDPATWGTLDEALDRMDNDRLDGIGFVLTADDPYVAVDLDHCIDPLTGAISAFAQEIVQEPASYTEFGPSGAGLRILVKGTLAGGNRQRDDIELSVENLYVTMTGDHVPRMPSGINDRTAELAALVARRFPATPPAPIRRSPTPMPPSTPTPSPAPATDDQVVLGQVHARYKERFERLFTDGDISAYDHDDSRADLALCSLFAAETRDPDQIDRLFRRSALVRDKWLDGEGYRKRTISRALNRRPAGGRTPSRAARDATPEGPIPATWTSQPETVTPGASMSARPPRRPVQPHHVERSCSFCGQHFTTKAEFGRHTYCENCRGKGARTKTPGPTAAGHDKPTWAEMRRRVLKRDRWRCRYCGTRDVRFASHIRPRAHGGTDGEENLVAACEPCHNAGLARLFTDFKGKWSYVRETRRLRDV